MATMAMAIAVSGVLWPLMALAIALFMRYCLHTSKPQQKPYQGKSAKRHTKFSRSVRLLDWILAPVRNLGYTTSRGPRHEEENVTNVGGR